MDTQKIMQAVDEGLEHMANEMKRLNAKQGWSMSDMELYGKMLEHMEKAVCIKQMQEEGYSGRSGRRGYSGEGYSQRSYPQGRSYNDGRSYDDGYSEQMRGANGQYRSADDGYSHHSIEDRMIANLEEMAGRAGNNSYEKEKIQQGLDALRRIFN